MPDWNNAPEKATPQILNPTVRVFLLCSDLLLNSLPIAAEVRNVNSGKSSRDKTTDQGCWHYCQRDGKWRLIHWLLCSIGLVCAPVRRHSE
jgi:hypothetical protein